MIYLILAEICWTIGCPDWCMVVCCIMASAQLAPKIMKVICEFLDIKEVTD